MTTGSQAMTKPVWTQLSGQLGIVPTPHELHGHHNAGGPTGAPAHKTIQHPLLNLGLFLTGYSGGLPRAPLGSQLVERPVQSGTGPVE